MLFVQTSSGGASAYYRLTEVVSELDAGDIVEVGSDRGEGSTQFFSALANTTGRGFYSIDFSDDGFQNAQKVCGTCARQSMGETWLETFLHDRTRKTGIALTRDHDA